MFDENDFFLNDDELAQDNQLDVVSSESIKLLELIKKTSDAAIENFKFGEKSDAKNAITLISSYLTSLIDFVNADAEGLSDEEICAKAEEVSKMTTELTLNNIDAILGKAEEVKQNTPDSGVDESGLDF